MPAQITFSRDEQTLLCLFSHPEKKNALTPDLLQQIIERLSEEARHPTPPRAAIFSSEGDIFSAGYDLATLPQTDTPDDLVSRLTSAIEEAPFPSIAAMNGSSFGASFDLACACDFRIGSKGSRYVMPPAKLGIIYAPRGLARFYAVLGPSVARQMFLAALPLSSERAEQLGVLHQLVDTPQEALPAALALAQTLSKNAPIAVLGMRYAFQRFAQRVLSPELTAEIEEWRQRGFASQDIQEGLAAFAEKRPPVFTGK
jgi:enoyl-CoA hydratase/carnithine racemase